MQGDPPKQASRPARAAFLSYASQDVEAAKRISEALRAAGIEVWFDQSELRGGDAWDRQIRKQIHDCALFIPIISAHSQDRLEGYFRREWRLAVERAGDMAEERAFLVPVVLDDTSEQFASVPEKFRDVQWTRLPGGKTPAAFIERVSRLLSPEQAPMQPRAIPVARDTGPKSQESVWKRGLFRLPRAAQVLAVAVAVVAAGYLVVNWSWHATHLVTGTQATTSTGQTDGFAPNTIPEKSIAVLPFVDMSEKHDQEYFADGMAEEIINLLVKIPELKVIGRTSSFQFKGRTDDLRKIGTTLGTAYVVEGSVRRAGDHVRVTAQLIDTRDGTHRWSDTYDDSEATDALKVQDEIAASLVRALQLEVTSISHLQGRVLPKNREVYDSYLRGLHAFNRYDQPGFDEAAADFRHALETDPSFVPAAEQLARTLCDQAAWGFVPAQPGFEQARLAADAAIKLDPKSAIAHAMLGCVLFWYDWDWPAAEREMTTAVALAPNDPTVLIFASEERTGIGQWREALRLCQGAIAADPLHAGAYEGCGWVYMRLGRLQEAEGAYRKMLEISPAYVGGRSDLGVALLMQGKLGAALAEMKKETSVGGQLAGLAVAYYALGRTSDADRELARLEAEHPDNMAMGVVELTRFRGHLNVGFRRVHDGRQDGPVHPGV